MCRLSALCRDRDIRCARRSRPDIALRARAVERRVARREDETPLTASRDAPRLAWPLPGSTRGRCLSSLPLRSAEVNSRSQSSQAADGTKNREAVDGAGARQSRSCAAERAARECFFDEFDAMRALRNACVAPVCGVSAILRAKAERRISPPSAPRIGGATSVRGAALYRDSNLDRLRTESGERFDFARAHCIIKSRRPVAERGFHDCRASACRANERSGRGGCAPSRRGAMRGAGVVQGAAGGRIAEEKYPVLLAETRGKLETTSMPRPYGAEFHSA
ncbi:Uncharacterised protein [Burkholderia pseudomallei]|nr:Uncharacterised protein [Burkholderia pseudomallei]CAJ3077496.1 Uncharacterised protein [Burkholderia pseudomallei]CAJ3176825.1 Uncharacterised protein [Burkholderia pseudomallei]CAJ3309324.1 Uncharacterised protein [Burkholderia pseudomallei]CAJ3321039.1 Uncharacterised protein [Burkholderia pseudomallei]